MTSSQHACLLTCIEHLHCYRSGARRSTYLVTIRSALIPKDAMHRAAARPGRRPRIAHARSSPRMKISSRERLTGLRDHQEPLTIRYSSGDRTVADLIDQLDAEPPDADHLRKISEAQRRARALTGLSELLVGYYVARAKMGRFCRSRGNLSRLRGSGTARRQGQGQGLKGASGGPLLPGVAVSYGGCGWVGCPAGSPVASSCGFGCQNPRPE